MIGILINGRLGNQLFQYASGLNLSKKLNTKFFIHQRIAKYEFSLTKYFVLPGYSRYLNSIKTRIYNLFLKSKYELVDLNTNNEKPLINISKIRNHSYLEGFFQSASYFEENKQSIVNAFQLNKQSKNKFESKYKSLYENNKIIAVHVRRTDYSEQGGEETGGTDLTIPITYYLKCMNSIQDIDNYKVIFVSDDIEYIKENFSIKPNYQFERNEEIVDFQIILNADIAILANSSFSWWAAYLNPKPNKIIYAPKYWFGFKVNKELPSDIIPDRWIQMSV